MTIRIMVNGLPGNMAAEVVRAQRAGNQGMHRTDFLVEMVSAGKLRGNFGLLEFETHLLDQSVEHKILVVSGRRRSGLLRIQTISDRDIISD